MFPIVVFWIFLSLRYGADLRRPRLVYFVSTLFNVGIHVRRRIFWTIAKVAETDILM